MSSAGRMWPGRGWGGFGRSPGWHRNARTGRSPVPSPVLVSPAHSGTDEQCQLKVQPGVTSQAGGNAAEDNNGERHCCTRCLWSKLREVAAACVGTGRPRGQVSVAQPCCAVPHRPAAAPHGPCRAMTASIMHCKLPAPLPFLTGRQI